MTSSSPPSATPAELKGCKPHACAIQSCLKRNEYQSNRCTSPIRRLHDCCKRLQAAGVASPHCAAVDALLPRKAVAEGEQTEILGEGGKGVKGARGG